MENNNQRQAENLSAKLFKSGLLSVKNLNKLIFFLIIALGVYYVAGINDLAIQGFALSDLKEQRNKLATENNKLELKAMTLSSFGAISEKIGDLKMVAVGNIDYLSAGAETMAKR